MNREEPVSARAVAMFEASAEEGGRRRLCYLILVRGEAGWYSHRRSALEALFEKGVLKVPLAPHSTTRPGFNSSIHLALGDIEFEAQYDSRTHRLFLLGQELTLGKDNVVLVDRVDGIGGKTTIFRTLRVDPSLGPGSVKLGELVARYAELRAYIK
jgi:hypothetical protein